MLKKSQMLFCVILCSLTAKAEMPPIKFVGDFRFRTENIKEEQASPLPDANRDRQRIRLRLKATAQANESTDVIVRLATGSTSSTDTNSYNQDLSGYYAKKPIDLDLAYFNWKASETLNIWGGKSLNPFYSVGDNDLVFDSDLTPEGMALKYKKELVSGTLYANVAASWLNERYTTTASGDNTDVGLVGGQLGYNYKGSDFTAGILVGLYNFSNIKNSTAVVAKGNTLTSGAYVYDYKVSSIGLEFSTHLFDTPLSIYAEAISNSEAPDYKTGRIFGLKLGKIKDSGSWSVSLDHRELEKDATVGLLADSDSSGGGTDIRSLRVIGTYALAENTSAAISIYSGQESISSTVFSPKYQRLMLDLNYNF